MESNIKNQEALMLAKSYLNLYASRYNYSFPDSSPTYAGFCEWAKQHEKEASPLEQKILSLFLAWLKKNNSKPSTRINAIQNSDITDFLSENHQSILLSSLLYCR